MPKISCKALLFDMDGVLVDSTPVVTRVWSQWARERGFERLPRRATSLRPPMKAPEDKVGLCAFERHRKP
jgi:sugar-phosphatase